MTMAALALALALLVAPAAPRRLTELRRVRAKRRRVPRLPFLAALAVPIAFVAPAPVMVAVGAVATTGLMRRRRQRGRSRRGEESAALQAALDVLVGELRIGAHPVSAFSTAAGEVGGPVGDGLRAVAARARLGADVAAGLRSVALRSQLPAHWERIAACWELAEAHGLAIASLMRAAQQDIVERERYSARVGAGMAGARTTAAVLAGLPVLGVGLGQLIGADPIAFLLSPGFGGWLLVIGVLLACAGLLWSDRITAGVTI